MFFFYDSNQWFEYSSRDLYFNATTKQDRKRQSDDFLPGLIEDVARGTTLYMI